FFLFKTIREASACDRWKKHNIPDNRSSVVAELKLFLTEAERGRNQGVLISMMDYSSRIDAIIEGMGDQLHNSANLFLIVGLAGTFFGMAEFGMRAAGLHPTPDQ